jgi:tRNA(Ile)-lysidine synthase TilS/MesJ
MKELEKLTSRIRQAAEKYGMICAGDRIAVGLSGGKDSAALLYALAHMRTFYPVPYELAAVTVDPGFPESDGLYAPLTEFCASLGVEHRIVKTDIAAVVFDGRKEKNPCSLCAKMRRGALSEEVLRAGASKLALGHHMDDAAATFLMNLTEGGRIGCFSPVTVYEDKGFSVIRPLIYSREREIRALVRAASLPAVKSPCPADGETARAEAARTLRELDAKRRGIYARIVGALERGEVDGWKTNY